MSQKSRVRYPVRPHTFISASGSCQKQDKYVHKVLINRLRSQSLHRKSVVRVTERPDNSWRDIINQLCRKMLKNILWPTAGIKLTTSTTPPSTALSVNSINCAIETTPKRLVSANAVHVVFEIFLMSSISSVRQWKPAWFREYKWNFRYKCRY